MYQGQTCFRLPARVRFPSWGGLFPALAWITLLTLVLGIGAPARAADSYELDTSAEVALTLSGAILFGLGIWAGQDVQSFTPGEIEALDPSQVPGFDRSATRRWSPSAAAASDVMVGVTLVAPLGLLLTEQGRPQAGRISLMYAESLLLSLGTTELLKNVTRRSRPYVYNDNPDIPMSLKTSADARRSFPSGHTANAFTAMVFLATVHGRLYPDSGARGWVWAGCLLAASTTGYLRYQAGKHFPSDILAGAVIGSLSGWLVPRLHEIDPASGGTATAMDAPVLGFRVGF